MLHAFVRDQCGRLVDGPKPPTPDQSLRARERRFGQDTWEWTKTWFQWIEDANVLGLKQGFIESTTLFTPSGRNLGSFPAAHDQQNPTSTACL